MNAIIATTLLSLADEVLLLAGASLLPRRLEPPRYNTELANIKRGNQALIEYDKQKTKRGKL